MSRKFTQITFSILLLAGMVLGFAIKDGVLAQDNPTAKFEAGLTEKLTAGPADFFVVMAEQADVSAAKQLQTKAEKGQYVFDTLVATADRTQADLRSYLNSQGVDYKTYYIVNAILVKGGNIALANTIASRKDVSALQMNHAYQLEEPAINPAAPNVPNVVEPNIIFVKADQAWALGDTGVGSVVASNDTGLYYQHPALIRQYRGCQDPPDCTVVDHNYNWWDATGTYPTVPNDGHGHGTHTSGTMVGDDGAGNQVGMAPGARLVACKNMDNGGGGYDQTFLDCFEWDLAPWDLSHANPLPAMAPDAINNSWGYWGGNQNQFRTAVDNLMAAGIIVEVSAGNEGAGCQSLRSPGDYAEVFTTGSIQHSGGVLPGTITGFSSRGPSILDEGYFPDFMAPGENIRSSVPGGGFQGGWSGTSMAGPHVTALIGLIWSAAPALRGQVDTTYEIIRQTVVPLTGQMGSNCGGDYNVGPNNDWGYGTIDALAAVQLAITMSGAGNLDGNVSDILTGDPVEGVNIHALNQGGFSRDTQTDATGYYTMTLASGLYDVTASSPKYESATVSGVEVITDQLTTLDFELMPRGRLIGVVTDFDNGFPLVGATVVADDGTTATTDDTGAYEMYLDEGAFDVTASMKDYANETKTVAMVSGQTTVQDFALQAAIAFVPSPVQITMEMETTDVIAAELFNRQDFPYDFTFAEKKGGFTPAVEQAPVYQAAPSIPAFVTTGVVPEGYVAPANVNNGNTPTGPWEARAFTPFATMDNPYVDFDGKGYLLGGYGANGQVGIYDPNTDSWTTGATEPAPQIQYPVDACVGQNENGEAVAVLFNDTGSGASTLHRYNIVNNSWDTPAVPAGFPSNGLWAHNDVSLLGLTGENICYITGGATAPGGGNTSGLYAYHPDTNTVDVLGDFSYLSGGFDFHAAWYAPWIGGSGAICVGGGVNGASVVSADTQCYDIGAAAFNVVDSDLGTLPSGVWGTASGFLVENDDFQLWVANGADAGFALWPNSAFFSSTNGTWSMGPTTPTTVYRVGGTNITADDGCSFYVGAGSTGGFTPSTGHNRNFSAECPSVKGANVPWLGEDPTAGQVPAGGSVDVTLIFSATAAAGVNQPGDYSATLNIDGKPKAKVPVTMTVLPPESWGKINGTVTDSCTGVPIEKAELSIPDGVPITQTFTNDAGYYWVWLEGGNYAATFKADGFVDTPVTLEVVPGQVTVLDQALRPNAGCLTVDPTSMDVTLEMGDQSTLALDLGNVGGSTLAWEIREKDKGFTPANFKAAQASAPLPPLANPGTASVLKQPEVLGTAQIVPNSPNVWVGASPYPMGIVRYAKAQCPGDTNSFYILAGVSNGTLVTAVNRYDADSDTWTKLADISANTQENPSAVCYEGKIYATGGGYVTDFNIYDIATDTWTAGPSMSRAVEGAAMAGFEGKIYVVGGDDDFYPGSGVSDQVNIFDIASNSWVANGTPMPQGVGNAGTVQLGNFLYIVGGWWQPSPGNNSNLTLRYDLATDTWETGPAFTPARADVPLAATVSYLYIMGGDQDGGGYFDSSNVVWRYDFNAWPDGAWEDVGDPLPYALSAMNAGFATDAVTGGEIWSVGGMEGQSFTWHADNLYRESEAPWTPTPPDVLWVSEDPVSGTLAVDGTEQVNVMFDAGAVNQPGVYKAELKIPTDSPYGGGTVSLTLNVPAPATWGKLTGTVTDACTGAALNKVAISIESGDPITQTQTNINGVYAVWLEQGSYNLTFALDKYITSEQVADIQPGVVTTIDLLLVPDRPCIKVSPDMIEAWVLTDVPEYETEGLQIADPGAQDLTFDISEREVKPKLGGPQGTAEPVGAPVVPAGSTTGNPIQPMRAHTNAADILVLASTDVSQSIERSLIDLGLPYDFLYKYGGDIPGTDFTPYSVVFLGMDGGAYTVADIQYLRENVIDAGKRLIFMGGTCWTDFAVGVNTYLVANDTNNYCWQVSAAPNWTLTDPSSGLAADLPDSLNFVNSGAGYYSIRVTDDTAEVVGQNGDGWPMYFYKGDYGAGDFIWMIDSAYSYYWSDANDYAFFKTTVKNAVEFTGVKPDVTWLWEVPVSGTVPAETVADISVMLTSQYTDGTPMPLGVYTATLTIKTNDPLVPRVKIPVIMHIVDEYLAPVPEFTATEVGVGNPTEFTNTSDGGIPPSKEYTWDFGDGTSMTVSTKDPVSHTYATFGTFTVTLTACNVVGCETVVHDVVVLPKAFFLPLLNKN